MIAETNLWDGFWGGFVGAAGAFVASFLVILHERSVARYERNQARDERTQERLRRNIALVVEAQATLAGFCRSNEDLLKSAATFPELPVSVSAPIPPLLLDQLRDLSNQRRPTIPKDLVQRLNTELTTAEFDALMEAIDRDWEEKADRILHDLRPQLDRLTALNSSLVFLDIPADLSKAITTFVDVSQRRLPEFKEVMEAALEYQESLMNAESTLNSVELDLRLELERLEQRMIAKPPKVKWWSLGTRQAQHN